MNKSEVTKVNKEYWSFVRETAKEVESWPHWMKGDAGSGEKKTSAQAHDCADEAGKHR
ncbi:MAG TPA: hypothetical protein VG206_20095 [Terriglobia bacterium]|nr:hypothetical protein [Terriglobia bacterium]